MNTWCSMIVFVASLATITYMERNEPVIEPKQQVQPPPPPTEPEHDEEPLYYDDELVEV